MSSGTRILKNRKGDLHLSWIAIILVIIIVIVLVYANRDKIFAASKAIKCSTLGVGEGYCVKTNEECKGGSPVGVLNCPKDKPVCCVGLEKPGEAPAEPTKAGTATAGETPKPKGSVEFYCKCKLDNGYLVADKAFNKIELKDPKKNSFTAKTNVNYEVQARATGDIGYCKVIFKDAKKTRGGACSKDNGPILSFKFENEVEFELVLEGYNKQSDSKPLASTTLAMLVGELSGG